MEKPFRRQIITDENQLILELCKIADSNKDKIENLILKKPDQIYVLGQLLYNRMGSVAYYKLKEYELLGQFNREFRNTLKAIYDSDSEKSESFMNVIKMLKVILQEVKFPYALLKGAYLATKYPKGLRTSNDVDILISSKDISELSMVLKNSGFVQGSIRNGIFIKASRSEVIGSRMNRGETVPFVKKVDLPKMEFLEIDINFSVDYKPEQEDGIVSSLLTNRLKIINDSLYTLSSIDFIIHLCLHLFKEATTIAWVEMGRDLSLYKFCDIYYLLNNVRDERFFIQLQYRIRQLKVQKECYYAMFYTQIIFDMNNEQFKNLLRFLTPDSTSYLRLVTNPSTNQKYMFDVDYVDYLFHSNRKELLYETKYGTT